VKAAKVVGEDMSEFGKIVGRARPTHREASEAPHGAAVGNREVVAVFLTDAKGVVSVNEIERNEIVARSGHMFPLPPS
jgi:hypothetical protein